MKMKRKESEKAPGGTENLHRRQAPCVRHTREENVHMGLLENDSLGVLHAPTDTLPDVSAGANTEKTNS